jgi:FlaG/FlaF family flagellin (archaellin)
VVAKSAATAVLAAFISAAVPDTASNSLSRVPRAVRKVLDTDEKESIELVDLLGAVGKEVKVAIAILLPQFTPKV